MTISNSAKLLTTHNAPERAIVEGVIQVAASAGIDLRDVGGIIHGATLATNALIERRGDRTAFTTLGFRDASPTAAMA